MKNFIYKSILTLSHSPKFVFKTICKITTDALTKIEGITPWPEIADMERVLMLSASILNFDYKKDMQSEFMLAYIEAFSDYILTKHTASNLFSIMQGAGVYCTETSEREIKEAVNKYIKDYIISRLVIYRKLLCDYKTHDKEASLYLFFLIKQIPFEEFSISSISYISDYKENVYDYSADIMLTPFLKAIDFLVNHYFNIVEVPIKTFITKHPESESFRTEARLAFVKVAPGFRSFQNVNGVISIRCLDCGHVEKDVIAFTHGAFDASIGRQCPNCGQFVVEKNHSEEYHKFGPSTEDFICPKCHYIIRAKEESIFKGDANPLFCPKCSSTRLDVKTEFMS